MLHLPETEAGTSAHAQHAGAWKDHGMCEGENPEARNAGVDGQPLAEKRFSVECSWRILSKSLDTFQAGFPAQS